MLPMPSDSPFSAAARHAGRLALVAMLAVAAPSPAIAQEDRPPQAADPGEDDMGLYEHRVISEVFVRPAVVDGEETELSPEALQEALNNIRSRAGTAFDADTVRADIQRLNRLGSFSVVE